MLRAVQQRRGKVKSFNADKATAVPGVVKVKQIGSGVAVLAKDFWTARTARDEIEIEWDEGENAALSTEALRKEYLELADRPGNVAEDEGDAEATLSSAAKTVEGVYEVPFLAHAPMEPLNATAHVQADRCDIWAGTGVVAPLWLRAKSAYGGGRGMFRA